MHYLLYLIFPVIDYSYFKQTIFLFQFHHLVNIWTTFWATPGFFNKFSVMFKGPGWSPGKPRLGLSEEIPEVNRVHEFDDDED